MFLRSLLVCFAIAIFVSEVQSQSYLAWQYGLCTVPPVVQNFNASEFFNGKWYQQSSYGNFLVQIGGICPAIDGEITETGEIRQLFSQYERLTMSYATMEGSSSISNIQNEEGYLPITYKLLNGLVSYQAPIYIVGTDYENWAVVYSCRQQLLLKLEMSWTLTRTRNGSAQAEIINTTIQNAGLDKSKYLNSTNVGCGPNEPRLQ